MQSRRFAVVVTIVIVLAFVVVAVAPAFAAVPARVPPASLALHARLASSTPGDGATVASAAEVVLTFDEDVNPDFVAVKVTGPRGSETDGRPGVDGRVVSQALTADLPAGGHTVTYRVVSTDGHPVSGTVTFTTTAAPASASPSATTSVTPNPSSTGTSAGSPAPTVTGAASDDGSSGAGRVWLLVAGVAVLAALGLGAARRTRRGRPADPEADAAPADDAP